MKPKVLKTQADYDAALLKVESLMDAAPGSAAEGDLELWSLLVERYESQHFPIEMPDPVEAIRFRMEQQGMQAKDLMPFIKSKSRISEVLSRKRDLTLSMIRALSAGLRIPAEVLLREPRKSSKSNSRSDGSRARKRINVAA